MVYTKIGCGVSNLVHRGVLELPNASDHRNARSPSSFPVSNRRSRGTISASMAEAVVQHAEIEKQRRMRKSGGGGGDQSRAAAAAAREEMERWMKETVVEIVRNLSHAPLLVHVYGGGGGTVVTRAEEWEEVKGKWVRGEEEMPEGMIFVEELFGGESPEGGGGGEGTRSWGLVVQGKWSETGPVCYLLKTTRVGSGSDSGIGSSTHFCLSRVSSFTESAESQLRNCWMVGKGQFGGSS